MTDLFAAINPDGGNEKFDLILLSDLVFNHSQHAALLDSCLLALSPPLASPAVPSLASLDLDEDAEVPQIPQVDHSVASFSTPAVLCFYSHHRPTDELIAADLGIITMAKAKGWTAKRVWKDQGAGVSPASLWRRRADAVDSLRSRRMEGASAFARLCTVGRSPGSQRQWCNCRA